MNHFICNHYRSAFFFKCKKQKYKNKQRSDNHLMFALKKADQLLPTDEAIFITATGLRRKGIFLFIDLKKNFSKMWINSICKRTRLC